MHMLTRAFILNDVSEIRCILKLSASNTNLLLNFNEVSTQPSIIGAVRGPTLNYGKQLSLHVPYMLRVNMTGDLAHLQLSDLHGETKPICRTSTCKKYEDKMHIEVSETIFLRLFQ